MKLETFCLVDESFQKAFPNTEKTINRVFDFCNKRLKAINVELRPLVANWNTNGLPPTFEYYLSNLSEHEEHFPRVAGFTHKVLRDTYQEQNVFSPIRLLRKFVGGDSNQGAVGVSWKNLLLMTQYFPHKVPVLYERGLAKLTLHELGHTFGLVDSYAKEFSIMDYTFGAVTSRFTKEQLRNMKI